MDDEGEDISRRRRKLKLSTSFDKTRSTSSCATPRYQWRSISWSTHAPGDDDSTTEQLDEPDTDADTTHKLCPPLQSLSVSSSPDGTRKFQRKGKNCLDIKLDMRMIEKSFPEEEEEPSELDPGVKLTVEKEKDKHCTQVFAHLFVGGRSVAQNYALLQTARITHILNCVGLCVPEYYPNEFEYRTLWLHDTPGEDIICVLYDVFDFLESVRERAGCQALVHCSEGVSRSAALVIAYIMWRDRKTFDQAFEQLKSVRSSTNPNLGFVFQLMQWQPRILGHHSSGSGSGSASASASRQGVSVSVYRMAPQSGYDPLYLVPKAVVGSGLESLDSRGCFVIQTCSKLYVWKGRGSDKSMLAAADRFAFQLIRYEHAHGPIVTVLEGSEPEGLVSSLTSESESESESSGGGKERLVSVYDKDFEIYAKARTGEFVNRRVLKSPDRGQSSERIDTS